MNKNGEFLPEQQWNHGCRRVRNKLWDAQFVKTSNLCIKTRNPQSKCCFRMTDVINIKMNICGKIRILDFP